MSKARLNKIIYRLFIPLLVSTLVFSCVTVTPTVAPSPSYKYNFSSLYNPSESILHPECRAYINSDSTALLFYRIKTPELMQIVTDPSSYKVKLQIKYILRDVTTFNVVDSSSFNNVIDLKSVGPYLQSYFNIKIPDKAVYKLIISISGSMENSGKRLILELDNSSVFSSTHFLLEEFFSESWNVKFDNLFKEESKYRISSKTHNGALVNFDYFAFSNYVCVPPYYLTNNSFDLLTVDSSFLYKIGDTLTVGKEGLYVLKPSSQEMKNISFVNGGKTFPEINVLQDMVEPLKILTTNKEYNEIIGCSDLKLAVDNFWLSKSNNSKFAKEQIRVFYNRVVLANKYFTEDKVGWKTDRGNLYVMMGSPSVINMTSNSEEWFYGENPAVAGILFVFDRVNVPGVGICHILRRDTNYQPIWAQALLTWKNGRIYTITNKY